MQTDMILNSMFFIISIVFLVDEIKIIINPSKYVSKIAAEKAAIKAKDITRPGLLLSILYQFCYMAWTVVSFIFYSKVAAITLLVVSSFGNMKFHPQWLRIDAILSTFVILAQMLLAGLPIYHFLAGQ